MEIARAIQVRHSVRAFRPDPVPQKILKEIMQLALNAPSWSNTQPWTFIIATGKKLEEIKRGFIEEADKKPVTDIPMPPGFPEPYKTRHRSRGNKMMDLLGIAHDDREGRERWRREGLKLFGAPCAIYICTGRNMYYQDASLNAWPLFDCGLIAENIMLLATKYKLGTIPQIQAVNYPGVLRRVLGIPESVLIMIGITIGYPNLDAPINKFRSEKEPLEKVATWHGF